jgi:hypothetical protein
MSAPVSIREVAARAGVWAGTVPNVLRRPEIGSSRACSLAGAVASAAPRTAVAG